MKRSILIIQIIGVIVAFSCGNKGTIGSRMEKILSNDSVNLDLNLLELKPDLMPLLDSIIDAVRNCPTIDSNSDFIFSAYFQDKQLNVVIESIGKERFDYTICNAIFYYKGYKFYYLGVIVNTYFEIKNQLLHFRCVNPDKLEKDIDDSGSDWHYVLENNELVSISYRYCGAFWNDRSRFQPD